MFDYVRDRFGFGLNYANKQISAYHVGMELGTIVPIAPKESHIRPLMKLPPEKRKGAIKIAIEKAGIPKDLKARHVQETVDEIIGKPKKKRRAVTKKDLFNEFDDFIAW